MWVFVTRQRGSTDQTPPRSRWLRTLITRAFYWIISQMSRRTNRTSLMAPPRVQTRSGVHYSVHNVQAAVEPHVHPLPQWNWWMGFKRRPEAAVFFFSASLTTELWQFNVHIKWFDIIDCKQAYKRGERETMGCHKSTAGAVVKWWFMRSSKSFKITFTSKRWHCFEPKCKKKI